MAVAGLHNVSAYDSAFLREARSPASRLWGEPERPNTRASSVLQMWRELEGEHVVSHPNMRLEEMPRPLGSETSGSGRLSSRGSLNGDGFLENVVQGDNETVSYPQSLVDSDNEHEDDNSFCSEQSTDLGETERDRVRQVFREWMRSGGGVKNHSPNASLRNNRSRSPLLGQNERERVRVIREWMQINSQHRGSHGSLRDESISEIGSQIEQVRDGQLTLLKGRFLLNQRLARDERPACTAVNELGLLRQRHAVSDLRDGFLSRLDQQPSQNVYLSNGQPQSNNDLDDEDETDLHSEYGNSQTENVGIHNSQDNTIQDLNRQENIAVETEAEVQILRNINREDETSSIELARGGHSREDNTIGNYWPENSPEETEQVSNALETVPTHLLHSANIPQNFDAGELIPGAVETVHTYLLESHPIYSDDSPQNVYASEDHGAAGNMYSMAEELPLQGILVHVEELQESESELEEYDLQSSVREISEWTEVNIEENTLQETGSQRYHEPANGDVMEQTQLQESDEEWSGNVLQEAISSWLDVPSGQETGSVGRDNSFYFPDEEDIQSTELRQLLGRRRVSTLLRSGFRESLDQLIQSYVQRQNDASAEWDLDEESSSHASVEQGQEPQHHNQDPDQEARWGHELQDDDWPDLSPLRHTQNKWEMINELRIDMAGLQQKMNNMQNMLEACMDLQLELQRSVRQEVSAALNRPFNSSADDSRWDRVRKGICCMCSDSHIDTLLYRCGHMCTCSKCADELVQGGKCPMCYAPVIEVVRAYFIQ
ncbi:hypothetical protein Leryth_002799 [Lithospermum erythrorhizon]|nr:hypothetical protein Leryth_002799 [Lithospermum erythrorhizon]